MLLKSYVLRKRGCINALDAGDRLIPPFGEGSGNYLCSFKYSSLYCLYFLTPFIFQKPLIGNLALLTVQTVSYIQFY